MAGRWIMNAQTGQPEWVEENQTPTRWAGNQTPVAPMPPSLAFQPEPQADNGAQSLGGNMLVQYGQANRGLGPAAPAGSPGQTFGQEPATATPTFDPGTVAGNDVGGYNPWTDLSGVGRNGPGQAYLRAFDAATGGSGAAFPDAPTFTADPAAGEMAKRAAQRDVQMQALLDEMRSDVKERDPARRTGLQRFGEFLSALAASGRLEDAGMIWNQLDQQYRQEGRDLRNEMRQITMAGFESEDRRAMAQAGLSSAEHGARERTTAAGYQRNLGAFEAGERRADRASRTAIARAEAAYTVAQDEEQRRQQALGLLIGVPGVSDQAGRELASGLGFQEDAAGSAIAEDLTIRPRVQGLYSRIQGTNLSNSRARNELATYLQQWDPTIRARDLQDADPEMIFNRVVRSPSARQAFMANPDLAVLPRYQGMIARPE